MHKVDLSEARAELERMLGAHLQRLDPDAVAELFPPLEWEPITNWGNATDDEIWRCINIDKDLISAMGRLVMVSDPSFYDGGSAFSFLPSEFSRAAAWHLSETNERIFAGGDVVMWCETSSTIWLFHHEGIFARVSGKARRS